MRTRFRMRLVTHFPQERGTAQTYDRRARANASPLDALTLEESLRIASQLGRFDRYDRAFDMLRRIDARFPDAATLREVRAVRYHALFNSRQYDRLLAETDPAALDDPATILLRERADREAAWHQLEAAYPYSWYSYRARELSGEPVVAPNDVPNGNVFPDISGQLASVNDPRLVSIRELMSIGLYRDAVREMKIVAAAYPDNLGVQFMLADLYVQGGEPFKANGVLQRKFRPFVRHGGMNVPHHFWEILFPLQYWDIIKAEAERRQLDPYLIASIIRQESGFEPSTVSNAGAVRIMQNMPAESANHATDAGTP